MIIMNSKIATPASKNKINRHPTSIAEMEFIHIISTAEMAEENEFKLGRHKGSLEKLLSHYKGPLINPEIYFVMHVTNNVDIKSKILKSVDKYRIKNCNNRKTNWLNLDLSNIISHITNVMEEEWANSH